MAGGSGDELHQLNLNLHPNEASGLLTIEDGPLLEAHDWEYGFRVVMDEAEAEDCVFHGSRASRSRTASAFST